MPLGCLYCNTEFKNKNLFAEIKYLPRFQTSAAWMKIKFLTRILNASFSYSCQLLRANAPKNQKYGIMGVLRIIQIMDGFLGIHGGNINPKSFFLQCNGFRAIAQSMSDISQYREFREPH